MTDPHSQSGGHGPEHHEEEHHIVPPRIYIIIVSILLFMTATTVWASYIEMGIFNPIVALAIGVFKATLVVLFFMHVKYSTRLTKLVVGSGVFVFLVLIGMTLSDYFTRAWGRW
jgi:cytochrome c oxidase subunit IV